MIDAARNGYMLNGLLKNEGYDWWWHSFVGYSKLNNTPRPFFIEYFIMNPGKGGDLPILGQLPENISKDIKPSYGLIKAGSWGSKKSQIHNFYGISDVQADETKLFCIIGGNALTERRLKGSVSLSTKEASAHPEYMSDSGTMSWDLEIVKDLSYSVGYGAGKILRTMASFDMFWHVAGLKSRLSGTVIYNGEEYIVRAEDSFGYQDKNWGRDFTSPWVWLNCNNLTSRKTGKRLEWTGFDVGGGRPVAFGVPIEEKILIALFYEKELIEFNFSKFITGRHQQSFNCGEEKNEIVWNIEAQNDTYRIEIHFTCNKDDMLLVNYEDPKGRKLHNRLWNGGHAKGTLVLSTKKGEEWEIVDTLDGELGGCEYGVYTVNP